MIVWIKWPSWRGHNFNWGKNVGLFHILYRSIHVFSLKKICAWIQIEGHLKLRLQSLLRESSWKMKGGLFMFNFNVTWYKRYETITDRIHIGYNLMHVCTLKYFFFFHCLFWRIGPPPIQKEMNNLPGMISDLYPYHLLLLYPCLLYPCLLYPHIYQLNGNIQDFSNHSALPRKHFLRSHPIIEGPGVGGGIV